MENIEKLKSIPPKLLTAHNVTYVVLNGIELDKRLIIEKAQNEAMKLLTAKSFLSNEGIKELENILNL